MMEIAAQREMSAWERWLEHPERLWARRIIFQVHLWLGMVASLYVLVMSVSGSMIVYRNELEGQGKSESSVVRVVEWLVDLHENLLLGTTGRRVNGIGAILLTLLCLTGALLWWPGIAHWRRSLSVNWRSSFARLNWDLHNALGFWCFLFVAMWGISGAYFSFPQLFNALGDMALLWLSNLHFGRFGWFAEALWTALGLVPAVLSFTGVFMCCHRLLVRKGAPLPR
jgi:uncharacterized iron-regulated membrane protein